MARKTRRAMAPPAPARAVGHWGGYLAIGLLSLSLGAGGTYLALRPALAQTGANRALAGDAALALANTAFDKQDWPTAVSYYTQAIAAGTDTPDIRTDLGTSYRSLHQPKEALTQFAAAQRENPQHQESLLNQGIVYAFDLGDGPRAVALWQQYLQRFPQGKYAADVRKKIAQVQSHPPVPVGPVKSP